MRNSAHLSSNAISDTPDIRALWQKDKDHFVHPFTDFSVFHERGCDLITDSQGIHVQDAHGKRFIDGIAGFSNPFPPEKSTFKTESRVSKSDIRG